MDGSRNEASLALTMAGCYDTKGNCLETPAEPTESKFHLTVKQKSYPVQKLVGLYWAYSGATAAAADPKLRCLVS